MKKEEYCNSKEINHIQTKRELLSNSSSEEKLEILSLKPNLDRRLQNKLLINLSESENEDKKMYLGTSKLKKKKQSYLESDTDSIFKGKSDKDIQKDLSIADGTSSRKNLIDREVKGADLSDNISLTDKKYSKSQTNDSNSIFHTKNKKFMMSGDFNFSPNLKKIQESKEADIDHIDEESEKEISISAAFYDNNQKYESELREVFFSNLKKMVNHVFEELKRESEFDFYQELKENIARKDQLDNFAKKFQNQSLYEEFEDILENYNSHNSKLLNDSFDQCKKFKSMLIDVLMFLDKQVLELSKLRRVLLIKNIEKVEMGFKNINKTNDYSSLSENIDNVTDSWVDKHSLLQKDMHQTLNLQLEKLESPSSKNFGISNAEKYSGKIKFSKTLSPANMISKVMKIKSEKSKFKPDNLNKKSQKTNDEKKKNLRYLSERNNLINNELCKTSSCKFEKEIYNITPLGFITERYILKNKSKTPKKTNSKKFKKKISELKEEIIDDELLIFKKSKMKDYISKTSKNPVQSMCTSGVENITESNLFIVKTRSGQEIKTKKCLEDVKVMMDEFQKDLISKENQILKRKENLKDLKTSVKKLESDLAHAKKNSSGQKEILEKEIQLIEKTKKIKNLEQETSLLSQEIKILTKKIEELKKQNVEKLNKVTEIIKEKFKEIESRNKKERQVHKDLMKKYNFELQSKNEEINKLTERYQELSKLNSNLQKEVSVQKIQKSKSKKISKNIVKPKIMEDKIKKRLENSEGKIIKEIEIFEKIIQQLEGELKYEEKKILGLTKEKEKSKKVIQNLEKSIDKKKKESSKFNLKSENNILRMQMKKIERNKSLEAKIILVKDKEETLFRLNEITSKIGKMGRKLIKISSNQIKNTILSRDGIKKKENEIIDQAKKEKYLMRMNEMKEEKIRTSKKKIDSLTNKISILEQELAQFNKIMKARNKSRSYSKVPKSPNQLPTSKKSNQINTKLYSNRKKVFKTTSLYGTEKINKIIANRVSKSPQKSKNISFSKTQNSKDETLIKELSSLKNNYKILENKFLKAQNDLKKTKKVNLVELSKFDEQKINEQDERIKNKLNKFNSSANFDNISSVNISEIYNLVREEVYATNSSRLENKNNLALIDTQRKNKNLKKMVRKTSNKIKSIKFTKIKNKLDLLITKIFKKYENISEKIQKFDEKMKSLIPSLKASTLDLNEIELGVEKNNKSEKIDKKNKSLDEIEKKLKTAKEELEIEQKNNNELREKIKNIEEVKIKIEEELKFKNKLGDKQLNDKSLIDKNKELQLKLEEIEKKKLDVEKQVKNIQARYKMNYKKINELKNEIKDKDINYETICQNLERLKEEVKEKEEEIENLKSLKDKNELEKEIGDDLEIPNQEAERLNSLIDEKSDQIDSLNVQINQIKNDLIISNKKNEELKIRLNMISQIHKESNPENHKIVDVVVEDPRVTEFATNGALKSFSFKNILTQGIKDGIFNTNHSIDPIKYNSREKGIFKESDSESDVIKISGINSSDVLDTDAVDKETKLTININNYNINNLQISNKTEKQHINLVQKKKVEEISVYFKSKFNQSFEVQSPKEGDQLKKSEIKKLYLEDAEFSDISSNCSALSKFKESRENNFVFSSKQSNQIQNINSDILMSPKNSFGNLILENKKKNNSSISKSKSKSKSLFSINNINNIEEEKSETEDVVSIKISKDENSNFEEEDFLFDGKKMNDSKVFSNKEILNAFEADDVIDQAMETEDVQVGDTALSISQRYVAKQEDLKKQEKKPETKNKQNNDQLLRVQSKERKNNPFDQSFNNNSFAFHSNNSEFNPNIQFQPPNLKLLNTNQSFAGQDPLGFVSGSSFGNMNMQVNNLLDDIKKDCEKNNDIKNSNISRNPNLMTVPEEKNGVEKDFEEEMFKAKLEENFNQDQFNTMNSMNLVEDILEMKDNNPNLLTGKNMIDIMKDFNTGQMDHFIIDEDVKSKNPKIVTENSEKNSCHNKSYSDSIDIDAEMGFSIKKIKDNN